MFISKKELVAIVKESMVNESFLLLSLLAGCKSECSLMSIAPELKNLKIPECVTQEVYPFETINWELKNMTLSKFTEMMVSEGYEVERRRDAFAVTTSGEDELMYDDLLITIKNVPFKLTSYLINTDTINNDKMPINFGDNELCDIILYFPIERNENGEDIIIKNITYLDGMQEHSPDKVGHSTKLIEAEQLCNKDFMAVVKNINPALTPEEDTGY